VCVTVFLVIVVELTQRQAHDQLYVIESIDPRLSSANQKTNNIITNIRYVFEGYWW
jgi:hypothetical protein